MTTNDEVKESGPVDVDLSDRSVYTLTETIFQGYDDDPDRLDPRIGEPTLRISVQGFLMAEFFTEDRHRMAETYLSGVVPRLNPDGTVKREFLGNE